MLYEGLVCVPTSQVEAVIEEYHQFLGHPGVEKLTKEVSRRYAFPLSRKVSGEAKAVRQKCVTCQACDHPSWNNKAPLAATPIPDHIMSSVSLDIFSLPEVQWGGETFNSLVVCVDRLSGWIIAKPTRKEGLTAEKTAHLLLDHGWECFGIPSIITSDQGQQFVGQWWRTMCARLGIRQAFSQAYRPQANGKAEVAGKTLIGLMRKIHVEVGIQWVEALPQVLRMYHDLPGETGLSPFQILFGRDRNVAGIPYQPPRVCEEAAVFMERMEARDKALARILDKKTLG
jgi:hypothetical protein